LSAMESPRQVANRRGKKVGDIVAARESTKSKTEKSVEAEEAAASDAA